MSLTELRLNAVVAASDPSSLNPLSSPAANTCPGRVHGNRSRRPLTTPPSKLRRVMARWSRYDLIAIDEVGYVPLAEVGAEFLFQVVAERAEKAAVVLTTNLPFSEWTQVIPNARLCKALLDRITDRAHILETGTESYRFRRTAEKQKKGAKAN